MSEYIILLESKEETMDNSKKNVFIIGSRGLPFNYSGYETFVYKLTEYHQNLQSIQYHVACKNFPNEESWFFNARCFNVKVPNIGAKQAIYYDVAAMLKTSIYIFRQHIHHPTIYLLTTRIGPFMFFFRWILKPFQGNFFVNPDGNEWARGKWSKSIQKYWKFAEKKMIQNTDLVICDSREIEKYIQKEYKSLNPVTTYISYGADRNEEEINQLQLNNWFDKFSVKPESYYLYVGRFIPENNLETIVREFIMSNSKRKLLIVTNVETNQFYEKLLDSTQFNLDERIVFTGIVQNRRLLDGIRQNAYAYFHGHEVGGTNPSLLEAMVNRCPVIAFDCVYSREVLKNNGLFFTKESGSLSTIISQLESEASDTIRKRMGEKNYQRIYDAYRWEIIADQYQLLFLNENVILSNLSRFNRKKSNLSGKRND